MENRAALLASNGFASMALDYLTPRITVETGKLVGNDYFEVRRRSGRCCHSQGVFVCSDVMEANKEQVNTRVVDLCANSRGEDVSSRLASGFLTFNQLLLLLLW